MIPVTNAPERTRILISLGTVVLFAGLFFLTADVFVLGEYLFILIPVVVITVLHGIIPGLIGAAGLMAGTYFLLRPASDPGVTLANLDLAAGIILVLIMVSFSAYLRLTIKKAAERETYYRTITEYTYDSEYWFDTEGTLIYQSPSIERITGYPAQMFFEGKQDFYFKIIHPEDREEFLQSFHKKSIESSEPVSHQYRIITRQGEIRWMESVSQKVFTDSGEYLGIRGNTRDITERKRIQQALEESEREYRTIVSKANSVIVKYNMDGVITFINRFGEELFGYSAEEIIGKQGVETINKPHNQNAYIETQKFLQDLIDNTEKYAYNINTNTKKDGTRIWMAWTNAPLYDRQGNVSGIICIGSDITARQRAEATIKHALEEKEILLREIHHRVKNNLQIISSMLHLQHSTLKAEEDLDIFITCENRINSMALIHDHLYHSENIARIEAADYIPSLCETVFDSYKSDAGKINLEFQIDPISIDIDHAVPCGLIITELVSNSIKHGFSSREAGKIEIVLEDSADDTVIEVRDNGRGMDTEVYRDGNVKNSGSLGLQLVAALVSQLGGNIELQNEGGVCWKIRLSPSINVHQ